MKKKIVALSAALMMFAGVVSASSINGDYKGNPIVKVTSNGKQLETDEVPAQIYDGHTVVPISLLRQLGASVTWDANTYSVDVKLLNSSQDSVSSSSDLIMNAEIADANNLISDTALSISDISNTFSLFFQGANNNYQNSYSPADVQKMFDEKKKQYNNMIDILSNKYKHLPTGDGQQIVDKVKLMDGGLKDYENSLASLLVWYANTNSNNSKAQASFNDYLNYNTAAHKTMLNAASLADSSYLIAMNKIIK